MNVTGEDTGGGQRGGGLTNDCDKWKLAPRSPAFTSATRGRSRRRGWLPNVTAYENGLAKVIAFLPERRKRVEDVPLRLPKIVLDVALAEQFQALLDAGDAMNRADLARRFRLTRARVTQLMKLLTLHPQIIAYVKALPPGTPTKMVTERGLRHFVELPLVQQLALANRTFDGFGPFAKLMATGF